MKGVDCMKKYDFNQLEKMEMRVATIFIIFSCILFGISLITGFIDKNIIDSELLSYISIFTMGTSMVSAILGPMTATVIFEIIDTIQDKVQKKQGS